MLQFQTSNKRTVILILVLALVIVITTVSWIVGSRIQSPAEAAARTLPPTPSPILVPVEERVLTSDIVTRGTARFGLPQSISIVPSELKSDAGVITTLPSSDSQLREGDLLFTASGRPVFVLQGQVPVFRDFTHGTSGNDVRQLEEGLQRLGFDPGPVDGIYDQQTSAAITDWYASAGWQPFEPTDDQLAEIRRLEQELAAASIAKLTAKASLTAAPLAVEAARARADSENKEAAADVATLTALRDRLAADPNATDDERAQVEADLAIAIAAANAIKLESELAIQAAVDAQTMAEQEARVANELYEKIAAELELAQDQAGVGLPADEIVFVPSLPVRVDQVDAKIGDAAIGPLMTVTNNQLAIDSSLPLDEAPLVKPGMVVIIDEPNLGVEATGMVERVASAPGTDGVDGFHIYFEVFVDETPAPLEGFSLRLTIPVETTEGTVTVVPISALSLAADGTTRVQVEDSGSFAFVSVEPGLSADGFVEVTSLDGKLSPGQFVVVGYENSP